MPKPPGSNPIEGANFFVPGPAHGSAAGAIAEMLRLGITGPGSTFPDGESWAEFKAQVDNVIKHRFPAVARRVRLLEKIATSPRPSASASSPWRRSRRVFGQAQKIFCQNLTADPGSIPIINTYFLHPIARRMRQRGRVGVVPEFRRQINEMAAATDSRPAVILPEIDAIGSSACIAHSGLPGWEAAPAIRGRQVPALPHTVVYVEAGYSDSNSAGYTARALNAIGVNKIRGFFTNDTHASGRSTRSAGDEGSRR